MSDFEIRQVSGDALHEVLYRLLGYAFRNSPPLQERDSWQKLVHHSSEDIALVAYDGEQPVASAISGPMTQNVRGKVVEIGGIWGVAAQPHVRRRGLVRELMTQLLTKLRDQGAVCSMLYAFRDSFYERLGYVTFPKMQVVTFTPDSLTPLLRMDLQGSVRFASIEDNFADYYAYMQRIQPSRHGMMVQHELGASFLKAVNRYWTAVAEMDGEIVGFMNYTLKDRLMAIDHFYYDHSPAKYLLLNWIARHIDHAEKIRLVLPFDARPDTWMVDLEPDYEAGSAALGRILDIVSLEGIQCGEGAFTAKIEDSLLPWNSGIFRFANRDGVLSISHADAVDCELSIQGLAALIYGTHDPDDFPFRGWGTVPEEAKALFPLMAPHAHERF